MNVACRVSALPVAIILLLGLSLANKDLEHGKAEAIVVSVVEFKSGFIQPVHLVSSGIAGDGRLFIVEQPGRIKIINANGSVRSQPFLDITDRVDTSANRAGLFGLAFHPDYASNGYFYLNYLFREADIRYTRISRFNVTGDSNVADPNSEDILLTAQLPALGHTAGDLQFGPDGFLYVPLGDGDSSMISDRPQQLTTLWGKMNRIDVDLQPGDPPADCKGQGSGHYSVPALNPYAASGAACGEIWASGMRNPWRFSFDPLMAGLFLPDIGEMVEDELNYQPAADDGGQNYGWPCYEGTKLFEPERCEPGTDFTQPVMSLPLGDHGDCSVIGGRVYRGTLYPDLIGRYIFTDYCSGNFRTVTAGNWNNATLHTGLAPFGLVAIGAGNDGELYAVNRENGKIYRVIGEGNGVTATPSSTPASTLTPTGTLPTATSTLFPSSTPSSTPTLTPTSTPVLDEFIYLPIGLEEDNDP